MCGGPAKISYSSKTKYQGFKRYRKCDRCGHEYATMEILEEEAEIYREED